MRTVALMNSVGEGASVYTAVAKAIATEYAEEGVREGQRVLGARSLLKEHPYERLMRDVVLYGVFDGTSHVMLQELAQRVSMEARRVAKGKPCEQDTVQRMREIYAAPPRPSGVRRSPLRRSRDPHGPPPESAHRHRTPSSLARLARAARPQAPPRCEERAQGVAQQGDRTFDRVGPECGVAEF